jgi:hypothetical protein
MAHFSFMISGLQFPASPSLTTLLPLPLQTGWMREKMLPAHGRQRTEFSLLKIINHLEVTSPEHISFLKAVLWAICLLTGFVMRSCKVFLMNYCWHSVQRLEGSSPWEEKADPVSCACCPWGQHRICIVHAGRWSGAPHPYSLVSRKGLRQIGVYH